MIEERAVIRRAGLVRRAGLGTRRGDHEQEEAARVAAIETRRLYYAGDQFDEANLLRAEKAEECRVDGRILVQNLPEHEKKVAYSTHIQESVDFLASQLASQFQVIAKDKSVQAIIDRALVNSPDLASGDDTEDMSPVNVLRDALIAGDVAVQIRWNAVPEDDDETGTVWFEFWEGEAVDFRYDDDDRTRLVEVVLTEQVWVQEINTDDEVERTRRTFFRVQGGECVREVYYDDQDVERDEPAEREWLGLPFIPWTLLRTRQKRIREQRGQSAITTQALRLADRYDATENLSYVIARYNSHGNVVVVGDGATLQSVAKGKVSKDVADVMTFPEGTNVTTVTLPTDPQMIEHQRTVLLDSLFGTFGLTRIDQSTITGMGQVSGYALEILNRKTEGTFEQVRRQFIRDLKRMLSMALDVHAYKDGEQEWADDLDFRDDAIATPEDYAEFTDRLSAAVRERLDEIDPNDTFAQREFEIRMGSGYIVDDVMVRDDFVANLFSRREALRLRGYDDKKIKQIEREIAEEKKSTEQETGVSDAARVAAARALADQEAATKGVLGGGTPATTAQALGGTAQATGTTPNAQSTTSSGGTQAAGTVGSVAR